MTGALPQPKTSPNLPEFPWRCVCVCVGGQNPSPNPAEIQTLESEPGSLSQCPLWVPQVLADVDFRREKSSYSEKPFLFLACRDPGERHGGHAEQMEGPECCTTCMVHELLENLQQPICHLPPMALVSCVLGEGSSQPFALPSLRFKTRPDL